MSAPSIRFLRRSIFLPVLALCQVFLRPVPAAAQGVGPAVDTLLAAAPGDTLLRLGRPFVLPGTLRLSIDTTALVPDSDFTLDARSGTVLLAARARSLLVRRAPGSAVIRATFEYLPVMFRDEYRLRSPVVLRDTAAGRVDTVYRTAADFTSEDFFGPRLRRSGSLVRGIQAGSNRDLTLNSGFRLQLSGDLSDDIGVLASLTDENSPIQPEGTTQTLQELDRVFIELRSRNAAATLGDLSLGFSEGKFGRINRKLRGALGSWTPGETAVRGTAQAGGASVRGKYTSNEFRGTDGVQGPYRLTGKNNEYPVIVIAGTEKVYIDGQELTRGLLNDYTIDYGLGEVTFTARRRITFASRVVVEFEYTDRRYSRDFLGGRARFGSEDGRWSAGGMIVREADDRDALQDVTLTGQDREILASAGDSAGRASRPGIEYAGPGRGKYELRDTTVYYPDSARLIDTVVLVYNPADTARALYNAFFSPVGPGGGDYEKVSAGHYRYAGPGKGAFLPLRFLPFPERRLFANLAAGGSIVPGLGVAAEYAASSLDRNTFSGIDDADNDDGAYNVSLRYGKTGFSVWGMDLASFDIRADQRRTGGNFNPPERFDEVEFDRNWNTGGKRPGRDLLRDAELSFSPVLGLSIGGYAGSLKRGDGFSSERYSSSLRSGDELGYSVEFLRSADAAASVSTKRLRQEGSGRVRFGAVSPRIMIRNERLTDRPSSGGGARPTSYGFTEIIPGISADTLLGMDLSADLGYRRDDSVKDGKLTRAVETFLQTYGWRYHGAPWVSTTLDLLLQKRRFDADFAPRNTQNTTLVRSLTRLSPADRVLQVDLYYEVSPEQSSRMERLFQQVPAGTGNYRYAGDLNGNAVVDEPDFRPVRYDGDYMLVTLPTDSLIPVLNLKSSARFRFDLSRLFTPGNPGGPGFLSPFSGETYVRIEEKTADQEKRNVYLLKFGTFRNPRTTVQGNLLFLQEFNLFEFDPSFSVKFRYQQKRGFARMAAFDETAYSRERGVRVRWSIGEDLSNTAEFRHLTDEVSATPSSARDRSVRSTIFDLDWTYKPATRIESSFGMSLGDADNYEQSSASLNAQRVSVTWLLPDAGRIRTEFRREEEVVSGKSTDLPFELTQGRLPGKTWIWGGTFEYRLTRFLESSLRYEGRREGFLRTVHSGNLEVRAFF